MRPDDFSSKSRRDLAIAANFRCVRPGCGLITHAYHLPSQRVVNTRGQAAHIAAAQIGGPRYDEEMTHEQRKHADNGVWLCASCATVVDRLPDEFRGDEMKQWQLNATNSVLQASTSPTWHRNYDVHRDAQAVHKFLDMLDPILKFHWIPGMQISWVGYQGLLLIVRCMEFQGPANTQLAGQQAVKSRQLAISRLANMMLRKLNHPHIYRPISQGDGLPIERYVVASRNFESDLKRTEWIEDDRILHHDACRFAHELHSYLRGETTFADCFW